MSNEPISIQLTELESSASAKFENIGDSVQGVITNAQWSQQTDPVDGSPQTWADGNPKMQLLITLEQEDGERVVLYSKGGNYRVASGKGASMNSALAAAVAEAGADSLTVGGMLAVAHTGLGEKKPGLNAPKLYTAQYRPPAPAAPESVSTEDLFSS